MEEGHEQLLRFPLVLLNLFFFFLFAVIIHEEAGIPARLGLLGG
jgi:hypothetical protein